MNSSFVGYPSINLEQTGRNIKRIRLDSGFTVCEICERLGGITKQSVSNWECGRSLPSLDNILALSIMFGVSINDMIVCDF